MTLREGLEFFFLAVMLLGAALATLGLFRAPDALGAIHAASFASVTVTPAFLLATAAGKAGSESTVKVLVLLIVVGLTSPIASHAIARAIFARSEQ